MNPIDTSDVPEFRVLDPIQVILGFGSQVRP